MPTRVTVPPGCRGLDSRDGTKYKATRSGTVTIDDDRHVSELKRSGGLMLSSQETWSFGTKTGRWCASCGRMWNAWSVTCPKCGRDTEDAR
jgi:hypothetical protein